MINVNILFCSWYAVKTFQSFILRYGELSVFFVLLCLGCIGMHEWRRGWRKHLYVSTCLMTCTVSTKNVSKSTLSYMKEMWNKTKLAWSIQPSLSLSNLQYMSKPKEQNHPHTAVKHRYLIKSSWDHLTQVRAAKTQKGICWFMLLNIDCYTTLLWHWITDAVD